MKGGSLASDAVMSSVSADAFKNMDSMFTNKLGGSKLKKKGGSLAFDYITSSVSAKHMNSMFTNKLGAGACGCASSLPPLTGGVGNRGTTSTTVEPGTKYHQYILQSRKKNKEKDEKNKSIAARQRFVEDFVENPTILKTLKQSTGITRKVTEKEKNAYKKYKQNIERIEQNNKQNEKQFQNYNDTYGNLQKPHGGAKVKKIKVPAKKPRVTVKVPKKPKTLNMGLNAIKSCKCKDCSSGKKCKIGGSDGLTYNINQQNLPHHGSTNFLTPSSGSTNVLLATTPYGAPMGYAKTVEFSSPFENMPFSYSLGGASKKKIVKK